MSQGIDDSRATASRPQPAFRCGKGRADRGALDAVGRGIGGQRGTDGEAGGADGAGGRVGGEIEQAPQDAGQLFPSALAPTQDQQAASPQTAEGPSPRRGTRAASRPRPHRRGPGRDCPFCAVALAGGDQKLQGVERIERPPIRPIVTRVRLHGGTCPHCGEAFTARPPPGLEPGSPFGPSIEALAVYLHHCQAIGFERLAALFRDIFGLPISEGTLANLFKRG